jgi:hypothetical protein
VAELARFSAVIFCRHVDKRKFNVPLFVSAEWRDSNKIIPQWQIWHRLRECIIFAYIKEETGSNSCWQGRDFSSKDFCSKDNCSKTFVLKTSVLKTFARMCFAWLSFDLSILCTYISFFRANVWGCNYFFSPLLISLPFVFTPFVRKHVLCLNTFCSYKTW